MLCVQSATMFFYLYWRYLTAGLILYVLIRLVYFILNAKGKTKTKNGPRQEFGLLKELNEIDRDSYDDSNEDEDLLPALPTGLKHIPLNYKRSPTSNMIKRSQEFYELMNRRRTVRHFSSENVPIEIVHNIIRTAGTAPSGAHTEPWTFVVVSSAEMKRRVREIIEEEEEVNYKKRMGKTWTTDLKPLRTNWVKEYLTEAPHLILVFKQVYSYKENGAKKMHYYSEQSVSIATGILLAAVHYAGLVSLTSTPLNCGPALRTLLERPSYEKLAVLLPVGYPAENCEIPALHRKPLEDIFVQF